MDLYIPARKTQGCDTGQGAAESVPVALFAHGGVWASGMPLLLLVHQQARIKHPSVLSLGNKCYLTMLTQKACCVFRVACNFAMLTL